MNLTAKISIIAIGLLVVLSAGLGVVVYSSTQTALQESIGQNQLQLAQSTMDKIDRVLFERYRDIQIIAGAPVIRNLILGQREFTDAKKRLDEFTLQTGPWDALDIINTKGDIIITTDVEGGNVTEHADEKKAFETAMSGKIYYSDAIIGDQGKPTVIFSAPIRDGSKPDKPIIGVALGDYSWGVINEIISDIALPQIAHLHNKDGVMIGINESAEQDMVFQESFKGNPAIAKALNGEDGSLIGPGMFHWSSDGQSMNMQDATEDSLIAYVTEDGYLGFLGNGWVLTLETPTAIAFEPATASAVKSVLILVVLISIAVIFLFYILYRMVIKPITRLESTAREISIGKMNLRAEVSSNDEIGRMAASFNAMTDSLVKASDYVRGIMKTMPTALIVMSKDGKITSVNDSTIRLLGWNQEELIGKDIQTIFTTTTTHTTVDLLKDLGLEELASKKHIDGLRAYMKDKNGKQVPVSLSASLLIDEKQDIVNIVFIAKDLRELTAYAHARLTKITPILQKVSTGDFSQTIELPKEEDEFSEHMVALNLMIDDFRQMVEDIKKKSEELEAQSEELEQANAELEEAKTSLEQKVQERTAELEKAKTGLEAQVAQRTVELQKLNTNLEGEVQKRTAELQEKLLELERFNKVAVGRELKMVELKEEIAKLKGLTNATTNTPS